MVAERANGHCSEAMLSDSQERREDDRQAVRHKEGNPGRQAGGQQGAQTERQTNSQGWRQAGREADCWVCSAHRQEDGEATTQTVERVARHPGGTEERQRTRGRVNEQVGKHAE